MTRPKSHYKHMTRAKAERVRKMYFVGRFRQREIAMAFGLSQGTVSKIVSGWTWA